VNRFLISIRIYLLVFSSIVSAQVGWHSLGNVSNVTVLPQGVELKTTSGRVRVTALSPNIIRVRNTQGETFPAEHSFAVLADAFPAPLSADVTQSTDSITVTTSAMRVKIYKTPLQISFLDLDGKVISQDQPGYPSSFDRTAFKVWKSMPGDEHYFGLGDKSGPLDHRNLSFTMWNTDMYGWQESTDPLYKDIPFLLAMHGSTAYGIFLDNTYRSHFDFGKESRDFYSFGADGGELDYYFFYGPEPKRVIQDFTALVGRTPLPPLFALGYQQCRYSYFPEARVREIAHELRSRRIPADVIYLDIDYQQNNRPFTIDRGKFPNFEGMVKDLKTDGFKIVAITDLHIAKLPGYKPYDEGTAKKYFVTNPDGSTYVGKVWPGDSVFPDFTRDAVRQWWGTLYTDFTHMGIRGFWNDMNEPAIFERADKTMPLDTVHNLEGRKTDHREIHNVFGMQNVRATYEGMLRLQPDVRPFVLTRAAYAGAQRYAATWTGDNSATWNHMRISIPQLINLGLSGYSFVGDDIGGFAGSPTPELLTRWMELGVFNPIYRNHATKGSRDREPWVDGTEHEAIRRRYIETRYRLLPYIYTGMEEASRTGIPFMRPMFLEFPENSSLQTNDSEFMFGPDLLVAPKVLDFVGAYEVTLPQGTWYDFWSGKSVQGSVVSVDPPLSTLPVYVRGGSIIPQRPIVQNVDEAPQGPLEINVYPGSNCQGSLYEDDGNTFAYKHGEFARTQFTCDESSTNIDLHISKAEGNYKGWWHSLKIKVYGMESPPKNLSIDGVTLKDWSFDQSSGSVLVIIGAPLSSSLVSITR
jgi:alpha-glucosidase